MKQFLIDTDTWIDFLNQTEHGLTLVSRLRKEGNIYASVLTLTELRAGWTDKQAEDFLPSFFALTKIVPISEKTAQLAGKFLKDYKTRGIRLPTVDTLIGATAIVENFFLVTRNKKDFPMNEIRFYPLETN